jgi:large subunit ribosomal protein L33
MAREHGRLECGECASRNYGCSRNKAKHKERLQVMKFCPKCRKHTTHKEGR